MMTDQARRPILITGAGGRLGRALARADWPADLTPILTTRAELDLDDEAAVMRTVRALRPAAILNAAAWADVDGAERDPERARSANVQAPERLARAAAAVGARLIHVSTDFVFDGEAGRPYVETDATGPLNVYGRTKLEGEAAVAAAAPDAVIVRTAWLVGPDRPNFLTAILDRAEAGEALRVTDDLFGSPTAIDDLAGALTTMAARLASDPAAPGGVWHFANAGEASWKELAEVILSAAGHDAGAVTGRPAAEDRGRAPRPRRSALASDAVARDYGVTVRPWREAVAATVRRMVEKGGST